MEESSALESFPGTSTAAPGVALRDVVDPRRVVRKDLAQCLVGEPAECLIDVIPGGLGDRRRSGKLAGRMRVVGFKHDVVGPDDLNGGNGTFAIRPSYGLVGLRLGVRRDNSELSLNLRNLTNAKPNLGDVGYVDPEGWFYIVDTFVAVCADTKQRLVDIPGLYGGYRDSVVRFRDGLPLDDPKFIPGSNPDDVISVHD